MTKKFILYAKDGQIFSRPVYVSQRPAPKLHRWIAACGERMKQWQVGFAAFRFDGAWHIIKLTVTPDMIPVPLIVKRLPTVDKCAAEMWLLMESAKHG